MEAGQYQLRGVRMREKTNPGRKWRGGACAAAACLGMVANTMPVSAAAAEPTNNALDLPGSAALNGSSNASSLQYGSAAKVEMQSVSQPASQQYLTPRGLSRELSQPSAVDDAVNASVPGGLLTLNNAVSLAASRHPAIADVVAQMAQADGQ